MLTGTHLYPTSCVRMRKSPVHFQSQDSTLHEFLGGDDFAALRDQYVNNFVRFIANQPLCHLREVERVVSSLSFRRIRRSDTRDFSPRAYLHNKFAAQVSREAYSPPDMFIEDIITQQAYDHYSKEVGTRIGNNVSPWLRLLWQVVQRCASMKALDVLTSKLSQNPSLDQDVILLISTHVNSKQGIFAESYNVARIPSDIHRMIDRLCLETQVSILNCHRSISLCDDISEEVMTKVFNLHQRSSRYFRRIQDLEDANFQSSSEVPMFIDETSFSLPYDQESHRHCDYSEPQGFSFVETDVSLEQSGPSAFVEDEHTRRMAEITDNLNQLQEELRGLYAQRGIAFPTDD